MYFRSSFSFFSFHGFDQMTFNYDMYSNCQKKMCDPSCDIQSMKMMIFKTSCFELPHFNFLMGMPIAVVFGLFQHLISLMILCKYSLLVCPPVIVRQLLIFFIRSSHNSFKHLRSILSCPYTISFCNVNLSCDFGRRGSDKWKCSLKHKQTRSNTSSGKFF